MVAQFQFPVPHLVNVNCQKFVSVFYHISCPISCPSTNSIFTVLFTNFQQQDCGLIDSGLWL